MRRTGGIAAMSGSPRLGHSKVPNQSREAVRLPTYPSRPSAAARSLQPPAQGEAGDVDFEALTFTDGQPSWPFGILTTVGDTGGPLQPWPRLSLRQANGVIHEAAA